MVNLRLGARDIRERFDMHCSAGFDVAATLERRSLFVLGAVEEGSGLLATWTCYGESVAVFV